MQRDVIVPAVILAAARRLGPSGSVRRECVQQCVELAVDIPARICVVWCHEENAGSTRRLERDDDPERSPQVLDAQVAQRSLAAEPVPECGAPVAGQVVDETGKRSGMRPIKRCRLLLCAKCRDYLNGHMYYITCYFSPWSAARRRTMTSPRRICSTLSCRSSRLRRA